MPTITLHPSKVIESASSYGSVNSSYPLSAIFGKGTSNTTYAQWTLVTGGAAETRVVYGFDTSEIPTNATITKVTCKAKCQAQNTTVSRGGRTRVNMLSGSTIKAESDYGAFGTSATVVTPPETTWTREQLTDCYVEIYAVRGLFSTTTAYWNRCYGIDLTVEYEVPADPGGGSGDHQTVIGGTAYGVTGGRCMVSGTGYDIKDGRTLVGGTGYDIAFSTEASLTWYLNATVELPTKELRANFTTSSITGSTQEFLAITYGFDANANTDALCYTSEHAGDEEDVPAYYVTQKSWSDSNYRTVTFEEPPTGDLLTWLEANGTPQ